jgi:hypothetical protein
MATAEVNLAMAHWLEDELRAEVEESWGRWGRAAARVIRTALVTVVTAIPLLSLRKRKREGRGDLAITFGESRRGQSVVTAVTAVTSG